MKEGVGGLILKHVREDFICNTEYLRELEMVMMGVLIVGSNHLAK